MLGFSELLLVLLLSMLFFGAGKLPKVVAELSKGINALKQELGANGNDEESKKQETKE